MDYEVVESRPTPMLMVATLETWTPTLTPGLIVAPTVSQIQKITKMLIFTNSWVMDSHLFKYPKFY